MTSLTGVIDSAAKKLVTGTDTVTGNTTLEGGGIFDLSTSASKIVSGKQNVKLVNLDDTLEGEGYIGSSDTGGNLLTLKLVNDAGGVIEANIAGAVLEIEGNTTAANLGGMKAIDGATLEFNNQVVNNSASGRIVAKGASSVVKIDDSDMDGGTFVTATGGEIEFASDDTLNGVADAIVNKNQLNLLAGSIVLIQGTIDNLGVISLGSGGATLAVGVGAPATLTGDGTINLGASADNQILGYQGATLTNVDDTIDGGGSIVSYNDLGFNLINKSGGIIDANNDDVALTLNTGATLVNKGKLEATDDSVLFLYSQTVSNLGKGELLAKGDGSTLELYQSTIEGGTLATSAGGLITTADGSTTDLLDGTKAAVDITGSVVVEETSSLTLDGAIDITGSISLQAFGSDDALLEVAASTQATLSGGGDISLTRETNNEILGFTGATLTNDGDMISGAGEIAGASGDAFNLVNGKGGVIDASFLDVTLTIGASVALTNDGTLEADSGALVVEDAVTGTGGVEISNYGIADFAAAFNQDVTFSGPGSLYIKYDASSDYIGTVGGFGSSDIVALQGFSANGGTAALRASFTENAANTGGVLEVFDTVSNSDVYSVNFAGKYTSANFGFGAPPNNSATYILYQAG